MEEKVKGLSEMTRADFEAVPERAVDQWGEDVTGIDSIVILPTRRIHNSDFRCMYFVACKGNKPVVKLAGGSDVIHIGGIGGFGYKWLERFSGCPTGVPPISWSIDCLKTSGLLRLFSHGALIADGAGCSSFELYADPNPNSNQ